MYNAHEEAKYNGAQMYSHGKQTESFKASYFDIDVIMNVLLTPGFEVSLAGANSLNHQIHLSMLQKVALRPCGCFRRMSYDARKSILTIIILIASSIRTFSFDPIGAHVLGLLNTARPTRVAAATVRFSRDSMATFVDRGSNDYFAHTRGRSYKRRVVCSSVG
jgi:hypothetical protein